MHCIVTLQLTMDHTNESDPVVMPSNERLTIGC